MKICVTGQTGFVGGHLVHHLARDPGVEVIPFADTDFAAGDALLARVGEADAIVHLAAMNRHPDPQVIHATNVALVDRLIDALTRTSRRPHVLFASSTQEDQDNPYGASKREGRRRLAAWAAERGAPFTGLVIPNVFGPFGRPDYNSVVATFCHRVARGEPCEVKVDRELPLVYVGNLCRRIAQIVCERTAADRLDIPSDVTWTVRQILAMLRSFATEYVGHGRIPVPVGASERALFNTFVTYLDLPRFFPRPLMAHTDARGAFVEIARVTGRGGQVSFSTTRPGITRGNHYHTRKFERFAVVSGEAEIRLRRVGTAEVLTFRLDGAAPAIVDMPIWYTHNIINVGVGELLTVFWIDEPFASDDPDTFYEEV